MNTTAESGYDGPFSVVISRPPGATGEVVVSRVMVLANRNKFPPTPTIQTVDDSKPIHKLAKNEMVFKISDEFHVYEHDMQKVHGEYKMPKLEELKFAIVIPSYKNEKWVDKNLKSVFTQNSKKLTIFLPVFG